MRSALWIFQTHNDIRVAGRRGRNGIERPMEIGRRRGENDKAHQIVARSIHGIHWRPSPKGPPRPFQKAQASTLFGRESASLPAFCRRNGAAAKPLYFFAKFRSDMVQDETGTLTARYVSA